MKLASSHPEREPRGSACKFQCQHSQSERQGELRQALQTYSVPRTHLLWRSSARAVEELQAASSAVVLQKHRYLYSGLVQISPALSLVVWVAGALLGTESRFEFATHASS